MSELIIKISAETKEFEKAVDQIKAQTADLENQLAGIAKISGVAFAALTGAVTATLSAYASQEKATKQLTTALQNQGIASSSLLNEYRDLASAVQEKTGIDDDAIISGQAILQGFLGQQKVTKELSFAMADLSERTGSVESAAEILGRSINGQTRQLKQFGIEIDANLPKEERTALILRELSNRFGGMGEAANQGLGGLRGLRNAFGDVLEEIGKRFAPAVSDIIQRLTQFFTTLSQNGPLLDFIAEAAKIGIILTGIVTALTSGGLAFIQIQKGILIAKAAMTAFGISTQVAIGATGIGLLLIVAGEIYANWGKIWPAMQAIFQTFASNISNIGQGLGLILTAVLVPSSSSLSRMKAGFEQLKLVVMEGYNAITEETDLHNETQTEKELEQNGAKLERVRQHNAMILEEDRIFREQVFVNNDQFNALSSDQQKTFLDNNRKQLNEAILSQQEARNKSILDQSKAQIDANNKFLIEEQRFGTTVATINKTINDSRVQGAESSFGQLARLQQSKNAELRAIGKAAAVAQITIDTAKSAMSIYTGFSTIPIIGPILGVAGAAAAVAFGAEQISNVVSAQAGGIIPGTNMGGDSVPTIMQPGEFVVPRSNFSEVVNAVASQRASETPQATSGVAVAGAGATQVGVEISFTGDSAEKFMTARQVEARSLGTLRESSA